MRVAPPQPTVQLPFALTSPGQDAALLHGFGAAAQPLCTSAAEDMATSVPAPAHTTDATLWHSIPLLGLRFRTQYALQYKRASWEQDGPRSDKRNGVPQLSWPPLPPLNQTPDLPCGIQLP